MCTTPCHPKDFVEDGSSKKGQFDFDDVRHMVTWASKCGSQIENNPTTFRCVPSEMLAAAWDRAAELCDKVQGALGVDNTKFLLDSDPEELKVSEWVTTRSHAHELTLSPFHHRNLHRQCSRPRPPATDHRPPTTNHPDPFR